MKNTVGEYPMGHHAGGLGMSHAQKAPDGHNAHMMTGDHMKGSHLARAAAIHATHRGKMGEHGVLVEATPGQIHMNIEAAYKAHHEGAEFGSVLRAMSTPHEIQTLHEARRHNATNQDIAMPREVYNEII